MSRFHLADVRQRVCLLFTDSVPTRIVVCRINKSGALMFLLDGLCQVRGDFDVIIGMAHNEQDVNFVAAVRLRNIRCGLGMPNKAPANAKIMAAKERSIYFGGITLKPGATCVRFGVSMALTSPIAQRIPPPSRFKKSSLDQFSGRSPIAV